MWTSIPIATKLSISDLLLYAVNPCYNCFSTLSSIQVNPRCYSCGVTSYYLFSITGLQGKSIVFILADNKAFDDFLVMKHVMEALVLGKPWPAGHQGAGTSPSSASARGRSPGPRAARSGKHRYSFRGVRKEAQSEHYSCKQEGIRGRGRVP